MMCALTDSSVLLYLQSPSRDFLSGICNIVSRSEQSHRNKNNKTVFAVSTCGEAAATALKHLGGWQDLVSPFMSLKSRVIQMAPLKHCDGSLQRVGDCVGRRASISAALEDTAVAPLACSTLAISEASNPAATLCTVPGNVCCQAPLSSRRGD